MDDHAVGRARVVLRPGDTIPADAALVGAVTDVGSGEHSVILVGADLPRCAPGCSPVTFASMRQLHAYRARVREVSQQVRPDDFPC